MTLTPSLELSSDRTVLITDCRTTLTITGALQTHRRLPEPGRRRTPGRASSTSALTRCSTSSADYDFTENFSTAVGVTNLLDQNYALADGFPEPGRQFYATARAKF